MEEEETKIAPELAEEFEVIDSISIQELEESGTLSQQRAKFKIVNQNINQGVQGKLRDGDLQKLANAVTMEVNQMAAQLFELISMIN